MTSRSGDKPSTEREELISVEAKLPPDLPPAPAPAPAPDLEAEIDLGADGVPNIVVGRGEGESECKLNVRPRSPP